MVGIMCFFNNIFFDLFFKEIDDFFYEWFWDWNRFVLLCFVRDSFDVLSREDFFKDLFIFGEVLC